MCPFTAESTNKQKKSIKDSSLSQTRLAYMTSRDNEVILLLVHKWDACSILYVKKLLILHILERHLCNNVLWSPVLSSGPLRIDYCNSLLFGSTHDVTSHLQRMQNYAARVILCIPRSSSITIHLKSLHWLPVKARSTYKIACLCYHCYSSTAPSYVADILHTKPSHTRDTRSSSYTMPLLNRHAHSKATLGDRSFFCFFICLELYSK